MKKTTTVVATTVATKEELEALEKLEKEFVQEYGEKPLYQTRYAGPSTYSAKIVNSKNPVLYYGFSTTEAKIDALQKAIESMKDE